MLRVQRRRALQPHPQLVRRTSDTAKCAADVRLVEVRQQVVETCDVGYTEKTSGVFYLLKYKLNESRSNALPRSNASPSYNDSATTFLSNRTSLKY